MRCLRVKCTGPGKSVFSASRGWKALDFPVAATAAESRGPAQSQCALPPALPPLEAPSCCTRSIPRRLLLSVPRAGCGGDISPWERGRGPARGRNGDGAGETEAPGPRAERARGERGPRAPAAWGSVAFAPGCRLLQAGCPLWMKDVSWNEPEQWRWIFRAAAAAASVSPETPGRDPVVSAGAVLRPRTAHGR